LADAIELGSLVVTSVDSKLLYRWRWKIASEQGPASATTRHVLMTLSIHMEADGGNAFPSEDLLALETALTTRAVSTHLRLAVDQGWLRRYRERRRGKAWAQYFYQAAIPAHVDAPERRSPPQAGGTELDAEGPERNDAMVPNDVPLNATKNATNNTTVGVESSEAAKAKRRADCAAFFAQTRRQIANRESVVPAINKRRRS